MSLIIHRAVTFGTSTSETSVSFCPTTRRNNKPEDGMFMFRREKLKLQMLEPVFTESGLSVSAKRDGSALSAGRSIFVLISIVSPRHTCALRATPQTARTMASLYDAS